jgi:protoheme IX farnesyltransferase
MFLWQIPHFWLLLIRYGKEYKAAGFRTISDHLNELQIKYLIFFWILLSLVCLNLFSRFTGLLTKSFSIVLIILNISFVISSPCFL